MGNNKNTCDMVLSTNITQHYKTFTVEASDVQVTVHRDKFL